VHPGRVPLKRNYAIGSELTYHRVTVVAMAIRPEIPAGRRLAGKGKAWFNTFPLCAMLNLCARAACALAIALLVASAASAQKSRGGPPPPLPDPVQQNPPGVPEVTPDLFTSMDTITPTGVVSGDVGRMIDSESCNSWTESGVHSPTVSAKRLAVPNKATSEYQKACGAFKGKRFMDAEEHLRKAIEAYPDYPAAWVVLGQVLESENKSGLLQSSGS